MADKEDLTEDEIEGLIFKTVKGVWVAFFDSGDRVLRCKVDYCPWCGKALKASDTGHTH